MTEKKLTLILGIIFFLFSLGFSFECFGRALEVRYVDLPIEGVVTPELTTTPIYVYLPYLYYGSIIFSGILALIFIIIAGFRYMTAGGRVEEVSEAKKQIYSAILGLLIISFLWIILSTINPNLLLFYNLGEMPPTFPNLPAGILLCKNDVPGIYDFFSTLEASRNQSGDELRQSSENLWGIMSFINENCYSSNGNVDVLPDHIINQAIVGYTIPQYGKTAYGAVLYRETGFSGRAQVIFHVDQDDVPAKGEIAGFTLCENDDCSTWGGIASFYAFILSSDFNINRLATFYLQSGGEQNPENTVILEEQISSYIIDYHSLPNQEFGSLKIEPEGKSLVIFFKDQLERWDETTELVAFRNSNNNLLNSPMGIWNQSECTERRAGLPPRPYACASDVVIVAID